MRGCGFALLLFASALPAQDTTGVGDLAGTVLEEGTGAPARARICLPSLARCSDTNAQGAFRLTGLRPGVYEIEVTVDGRPPVRRAGIDVRAGLEGTVEVTLPRLESQRQEITVTESAFIAPEEIKNSGFLVTRQEVSKSAGSLQDVARYVQTLPGVAIGSNDFRNDIIVRGGSPLENLFVVDNIEIPNINAFANFASAGGTVSLLDAKLIQDVTFLTGGYPAPYINRTSSVLQIAQREGDRERLRGRVTLGFAGGGTIFEGPIRKNRGSWIVSARRSFLDAFTKDVGFGGVPILYTFNAKALYDLTPRDRIWAVSVSGLDNIRLGARDKQESDDEEVKNLDIRYDGWRSANGFNWQRLFGDNTVGLLGLTRSEAKVGSAVRDLIRNGPRPPGVPVETVIGTAPIIYSDDSREGETTLKYDLTAQSSMAGKVQAGGSFKIFNIRYNTQSPFGTNSPYSLERDLNPFSLRRTFRAYQTGAYLQATRDLTRRLNLTLGGRLDHYDYLGKLRMSPRAGLSFRLTPKLSWRASYGQYYQQPQFLFLTAFPQNRDLVPFRADHYVTGFTYLASPTLRFTVEAYAKNYKDYPVSTQFPTLSLANVGDTFAVRDILFPLTSAGRGRVRGIEFFAEKKFSGRWFGQTNFAWLRSRQAGLDGVRRPSVYDYPRVANLVGGYRLNRKWEFSTRVAYLAGRPYTPFLEDVSRTQQRGIFDLTRVNALRLRDYIRVDIRAPSPFEAKPCWSLLVFRMPSTAATSPALAGTALPTASSWASNWACSRWWVSTGNSNRLSWISMLTRRGLLSSMLASAAEPDLANLFPILEANSRAQRRALAFLDPRWKKLDAWKKAARPELIRLLRYSPAAVPLSGKVEETERREGFRIERITISATAQYSIPGWLLIPDKQRAGKPGLIAIHDHSGRYVWGHEKILSAPGEPEFLTEFRRGAYGRPYAEELARRGFVVLIVDGFYFGSRRLRVEDMDPATAPPVFRARLTALASLERRSAEWTRAVDALCGEFEHLTAKTIFTSGATWPGMLVWDDRRAVDYLCSRPEVNAARIGCLGLSIGGLRTAYLIGADPRIKAACVMGWMTEFHGQLRNHLRNHTWMVYVPGLTDVMDLPDVAGLHAPGALLVQQCRRDALFPIEAMQGALTRLEQIYAKAGMKERFRGSFHDVPHSFLPEMQAEAFEWLERWL